MVTLFFSYSHRDEGLRDELETHLAALKRQGIINTWHDRRIGAGHEFDNVIDRRLEESEIILLLVSPYFIASDYCYNVEVSRAMERHESGDARVIPVILHPCDWTSTPFGRLLAVPRDGNPVSKYPNPHDAFLEVTQAVRQAAEEFDPSPTVSSVTTTKETGMIRQERVRSSNLRIRKQFTDHDSDTFLHDSFEYMARFFEGSLDELGHRYPEIDTTYKRIDANAFDATIYRSGTAVNRCRIRIDDENAFGTSSVGIAYSHGAQTGGYNEIIYVKTGPHSLHLKPMGMFKFGQNQQELSQQGAAEYYWARLIEPLQQ